jgi:hypothetical protein
VVEEANVVVLLFQRSDLALDEVVNLPQELDEFCRQLEVHVVSPCVAALGAIGTDLGRSGPRLTKPPDVDPIGREPGASCRRRCACWHSASTETEGFLA